MFGRGVPLKLAGSIVRTDGAVERTTVHVGAWSRLPFLGWLCEILRDAKVVGDSRDLRHVAHQALRAVGIQVVRDNMPLCSARIARNGLADMGREIDLGAGRSNRWADDLSSHHIEVDHE